MIDNLLVIQVYVTYVIQFLGRASDRQQSQN